MVGPQTLRGPRGRSATSRRVAWTVADQAVSGLTNAGTAVLIARSESAASFGAYGVGFVVYALALGIVRGMVGQPLAIRESVRTDRDQVCAALSTAVALGAAVGVVVVAAGAVVRGDVGGVLLVLGVLLPGLLLQDALRFALFAHARPARAVGIDLVWGVGALALVGGAAASGASVVVLTGAWAIAGVLSALVGLGAEHLRPAWRSAGAFVRRHRDIGPRLTGEYLAHTGSAQLSILVLGALVGATGVGAIRGAQTLYGPFLTALTGLVTAAIPEGSRLYARIPDRLRRGLASMSGGLCALAVGWAAVLLSLPDSWGTAVLGDTWTGARDLLLPIGVACVGYAVASGGEAGLRITAAAREALRIRLAVGLLTVGAAVAGGIAGGTEGAVWALAIGPWATALATWWTLGTVLSRPARRDGLVVTD